VGRNNVSEEQKYDSGITVKMGMCS